MSLYELYKYVADKIDGEEDDDDIFLVGEGMDLSDFHDYMIAKRAAKVKAAESSDSNSSSNQDQQASK